MNVYGTEQIRNVVLLGHGGAGNDDRCGGSAFITGVTKRMGKVPDGNTISDYDKEEIKRQFSISTTSFLWNMKAKTGLLRSISWILPDFLISWEKQRKLSA